MSTKVVSYSEIDTYRQCPLKWQLAYLERWRTEDEAPALSRGTAFHAIMENHYLGLQRAQRGDEGSYSEIFWPNIQTVLNEQPDEERELLAWMFDGYRDLYGEDSDWEIVAVEQRMEQWLLTENGTRSTFKLAGTADLIVRDHSAGGGLWIVDHKTCKNLPKGKDLDMEDQTALYTLLARSAGYDIRGAIYNHVRTQKLKAREMGADERFKRTLTVRTDRELETMSLEALEEMREAYRPRRTEARRRPDGERCGWKCGFTEACLVGRKNGPERMRAFLEDTGFTMHDTKPGPTFRSK